MTFEDFVATARAAWPEWPGTDADGFARFVDALRSESNGESSEDVGSAVAGTTTPEVSGQGALNDLHAGDLWLAYHAGRGLTPAVVALEAACFSDLVGLLRARRAEATEAEEAVQRLRDRLLVAAGGERPRIFTYGGRGPLKAWVRVACVRTWLNLRRENLVGLAGPSADESVAAEASADPELELLKGKYRELFQRAFLQSVEALAPGTRLLLKLHYLDRLPMEGVGRVLGVHRLTVLRRLERARQELSAATKERLEADLRLSPPDVESVLRLIQSRLDVSLQQALASAASTPSSTG